MIVVKVLFTVKTDCIADFIALTSDNVSNSRKEAGVISFDFFRIDEGNSQFMLLEQYGSAEDQAQHRETAHYKKWKGAVTVLLSCPYTVVRLEKLV